MVQVEIGRFNRLTIIKERSVGYFFDGGDAGDILMPKRHQPEHCEVGDELDVFVFHDAEERLTATVRLPAAQVGEVAWLEVVATHRAGAFMDWGMTKDLLVPFREQEEEMEAGEHYLVKILLDDRDRIIGSSKLEERLENNGTGSFKKGQEVSLIIAERYDIGYRAVVDHTHWGMLYESEVFQRLRKGQKITGYISKVREDGRLDLSLKKPGYSPSGTQSLGDRIMARIEAEGGFLALSDKSEPEAIYEAFQVSKKSYKQAVGNLYKERRITIEPEGLRATGKGYKKPKSDQGRTERPSKNPSARAERPVRPKTSAKSEAPDRESDDKDAPRHRIRVERSPDLRTGPRPAARRPKPRND